MLKLCLERVVAQEAGGNRFLDRCESSDRPARLNAQRSSRGIRRRLIEIGQHPDMHAMLTDVGSGENRVLGDFALHIKMPALHVAGRDVFGNVARLRNRGVEVAGDRRSSMDSPAQRVRKQPT